MPASMISEVTGSNLKVIGSSIAIVAVGPIPGSTPTIVPRKTPTKHQSKFHGLSAVSEAQFEIGEQLHRRFRT